MLFARVFWSCSVFARQQYWRAGGDGDSHAPTCTRGRSSFANKRIERAGNQQTERACDVTLYPSGNNTNRAAHVNFLLPFIWRLRWKPFIAPKSALVPKPAGSGGKSWKSHSSFDVAVWTALIKLSLLCLLWTSKASCRYNQDRLLVRDKVAAPDHKMRI